MSYPEYNNPEGAGEQQNFDGSNRSPFFPETPPQAAYGNNGFGAPQYENQPQQHPFNGYPQQPQPYNQAPLYPTSSDQSKTMSILSLVFAFVFAPVGIVLGIFAYKKAKQFNEPTTLSTWGIILGSIFTFLNIILFIVFTLAFSHVAKEYNNYYESDGSSYTSPDTGTGSNGVVDESGFLLYVEEKATAAGYTWDETTPELAITSGEAVCSELDYGTPLEEIYRINDEESINPEFTELYNIITDGAVVYLCPEYS